MILSQHFHLNVFVLIVFAAAATATTTAATATVLFIIVVGVGFRITATTALRDLGLLFRTSNAAFMTTDGGATAAGCPSKASLR